MKKRGNVLFQPFDQEGLRMEPLNLKVNPDTHFARERILHPLKELSDQFVSEGVLVSDNSCNFSSPFYRP